MKKSLVIIFFFLFNLSFGQKLNSYKYALVPSKFSFLSDADQYKLNSLTKFLMEKQGFVAFLDTDKLPEDFIINNCNKIFVDVESKGGMLGTKLIVVLKDCKNNILFTSDEGKSKEKDYSKAYHEALRVAFNSFTKARYKYTPTDTTTTQININSTPIVTASPISDTNPKSSEVNLYAQITSNGYQLVDSTPKVVMKIYSTSIKDIYIAEVGNIQGVFVSKDNQWYFEYYQNEKLISEKINVKF
jgi:hypothetical protein